MSEAGRIEGLANWYLKDQTDFDVRMIRFRYDSIKPYLRGLRGLELGPAEGQMTRFLVDHFETLTVVEGSGELLATVPNSANIVKIHAMFEQFEPSEPFDTVVMEHILEHVERPVELLMRAKGWLAPGGRIIVGVPNANSIHRLVAVKMGLLTHPAQLNSRDLALGHRRVYSTATLAVDIAAAGLRREASGGVFFKPLSNQQIQEHWTEDMIRGFFELGKDFPDSAAEIYSVCVQC